MNKTVKILLAAIVAFFILTFLKNGIVGSILEAGISGATHVPVHIGSTNVSFLSGSMDLRNIHVMNPSSFPERSMLDAPQVAVKFDPWALRQHQAHFKEVKINLKELVVIKNRDGSLNIDAMKPKQEEKKKEEPQKGASMSLKIDTLHLTIGRVVYKDYSAGEAPAVQNFDINIQDRVYENIENPTALVSLVMLEALKNTALSKILNLDLSSFKDGAQGIITSGLGFATDKGAGLVGKGTEAVGDTAKGILNLFK